VAKKVVGLKLGASRLNAACVAVNGSTELVQLAGSPMPSGVIAGGEVREVEALAEALKGFFGKHKLPKRNVRIGLANNRIGVRTIEVSGIEDPKQLANAVRFRAQEALPIPIDEAVLDFQTLGEGVASDGTPTKRVLLVVAYRDLVHNYGEACRLAGLRLLGVDLEAFALLRAQAQEAAALRAFRRHSSWYTKGFRGGAPLRDRLMRVESLAGLEAALADVDRSHPFPPDAMRVPRGKTAGRQKVALPEGYLEDLDDATPPSPLAEVAESGG